MLQLDPETRERLWRRIEGRIEEYIRTIGSRRVTPALDPQSIRDSLAAFDFAGPVDPEAAIDFVTSHLEVFQTHTAHPRYYGLFNPNPAAMGIYADALAAAYNPQLAAWSHSPFAIEVEHHLIRALGSRFGYNAGSTDGTFASGGAEANHTALLAALTQLFPAFPQQGLRSVPAQPVFFASRECHHSFHKAARMCGLGQQALREIPVDAELRMIPAALEDQITRDRAKGFAPFLVVATAGTTNAAAIDPLAAVTRIAAGEGLWCHVDAAWGGACALSPSLRGHIAGCELADSITFDAHKWLSVPMGAGLFLTRHQDILSRTFRTPTAYMPKEAAGLAVVDPHLHSMQWSRRFIGLKVFLSLLVAGWQGYAEAIDHMTGMGSLLRSGLQHDGWEIRNRTDLPVICFRDRAGADPDRIARAIVASGEAWVSTTLLGGSELALRACITNYRTSEEDVRALIASLGRVRAALRA